VLSISPINHLLILSLPQDSNSDNEEEVCEYDSPVHSSIGWGKDTSESGIRNALKDYARLPGIIIITLFTNVLLICLIRLCGLLLHHKCYIRLVLNYFSDLRFVNINVFTEMISLKMYCTYV